MSPGGGGIFGDVVARILFIGKSCEDHPVCWISSWSPWERVCGPANPLRKGTESMDMAWQLLREASAPILNYIFFENLRTAFDLPSATPPPSFFKSFKKKDVSLGKA